MGNCWSCGAPVGGARYIFTCPACEETAVMKDIGKNIRRITKGQDGVMLAISSGLEKVAAGLSGITDELCTLSGIVQGGFDELNWALQQQTEVLLSIDETLKSPSQTQAREWRKMAEELRSRGCLDEAEKWFLKSLETSPLDFRTYVGLAMNYVRKNDFDKAEEVLTRSFSHAPKGVQGTDDALETLIDSGNMIGAIKLRREMTGEGLQEARHYVEAMALFGMEARDETVQVPQFDYKSLSHRLIGRIYACRGNYGRAAAELRLAIDLSPEYTEGNYDYALYCVQSGTNSDWEQPLRRAITAQPGYLNVAWCERRFAPARKKLESLLTVLLNEAYLTASRAIQNAETKFAEAERAAADVGLITPGYVYYKDRVKEAGTVLATAKSDWSSKDYSKLVRARADAARATEMSSSLEKDAGNTLMEFRQQALAARTAKACKSAETAMNFSLGGMFCFPPLAIAGLVQALTLFPNSSNVRISRVKIRQLVPF